MGDKPDMQDVLQKLRAKYVSELPDKLNDLEDIAMAIAARDAAEDNMLELYRRVHSIKGSAGSYGVPIISTICHRFEDRINEAQEEVLEGDRPFIDDALRFVDLLRATGDAVHAGETDFAGFEARLEEMCRPADAGAVRPVTVLVADSARTTVVMLRAAFRDRPVTVVTVDTEFSALERLMDETFDVVVCGLRLGRVGGLGLIAALKLSDGRSKDATTVLLTTDPAAVATTSPAPDRVLDRGPNLMAELIEIVDAIAKRPSS